MKPSPVKIYTDGCCKGNQNDENIGAWAYYIDYLGLTKQDAGIALNTTNNQMEILAVIKGLQRINNPKGFIFEIYSDSQYVVKGISEWSKKWIANNWKNSLNKQVENKNLWIELLNEIKRFDNIQFIQVKGHSNNVGNNRADQLCNQAIAEYYAQNP